MKQTPSTPAMIEILMMDVDGVLTDGTITMGEDGTEHRNYNARDGIGILLAKQAGIELAIVTSSPAKGILIRAERLGINHICIGVRNKKTTLQRLAQKLNYTLAQVAFVGDDLVDLPAMHVAGLSFAVADAEIAVRDQADIVTTRRGGRGAIRQVCELLIAARDPAGFAQKNKCGLLL